MKQRLASPFRWDQDMAGPVDERSASMISPTDGATPMPAAAASSALTAVVSSPETNRQPARFAHDEPTNITDSAGGTPDWSLVHFDVGCARCGHDLRGQTEPKCPACGLEFEWSVAVPLEELVCAHCGYHLYGLSETRCPECGESFTWEAALADYHLRCKPWFEYQWTQTPLRSFTRAITDALRPWRLWREMSIHDPPRVTDLLVLWLASAALLVGVPIVQTVLFTWFLGMLSPPSNWITFFDPFLPVFGLSSVAWALYSLVVWNGAVFLTLLTMRWSLARCKVRWHHVLRVCVYLVPLICWIPGLVFVTLLLYDLSNMYILLSLDVAGRILSLILLALMAITIGGTGASLALAYRRYIKMPHAWGVAIAASLVGFLCLGIASTWASLSGVF